MAWSFTTDKPIFVQLIETVQKDIVFGRYPSGERLPTVRDFAIEAGVNPNTVQRAYQGLEDTGLIYVKRGDGRYVTEDKELINQKKNEYLEKETDEYLAKMFSAGQNFEDIQAIVKKRIENKERSIT